jgi:hypothetical protein
MTAHLAKRIAIGYDPTQMTDRQVPSYAQEFPSARAVVITHPSNDKYHPNVTAALARYAARGWDATFVPAFGTTTTAMADAFATDIKEAA